MYLYSITSLLSFVRKTFGFQRRPLSLHDRTQSGQALVEYILILVVAIGVIWLAGRQLFEPLQKYGSRVFSSTIACALEYGQLPADIKDEEGCAASIQAQGSGGTSRVKDSGSQSKNSGGSKDGSGVNNGSSKGKKDLAKLRADSKSSGPRASSVMSPNGRLQLMSATNAEASSGTSKSITYGDTEGRNGAGSSGYAVDGAFYRRSRIIRRVPPGMEEVFAQDSDKQKKIEGKLAANEVSNFDGGKSKNKKFRGKIDDRKKGLEEQVGEVDYSKLIRMALIILLIIAILVFIFFQLSQIRKNTQV